MEPLSFTLEPFVVYLSRGIKMMRPAVEQFQRMGGIYGVYLALWISFVELNIFCEIIKSRMNYTLRRIC